jgi:hypothetical protein
VRYNPINYNDPTGNDVGCSAADPECQDSNGLTENAKVEIQVAENKIMAMTGWDLVPVVNDVRGIIRGTQIMKYESEQPGFKEQQTQLQGWQNNCYGQCHYSDSTKLGPSYPTIGGPMPSTPVVDKYSEGAGEAASGVVDIGITAATLNSETQIFAKGGKSWHLGLETKDKWNIVHIGNHPRFGIHIAIGAIGPKFADLHIYLQSAFPFFRPWKP